MRMFIVCCAADARPLAVPVEVYRPDEHRRDGMGEGGWKSDLSRKMAIACMFFCKADKVESTDPPAEAMLY